MPVTTKIVVSMALAASAIALFSATNASAACRQQFTNTTCVDSGPPWARKQTCTNHFKTVCDTPASSLSQSKTPALAGGTGPRLAPATNPATAAQRGTPLIGHDGASLIGHDGASLTRR